MLSFDDIEVQRESGLPLDTLRQAGSYPQFRFMGSKHRLLPWLAGVFRSLKFDSALDAFSGSGSVAYLLKTMGKTVTTNDFLSFGYHIANGLVANPGLTLEGDELERLLRDNPRAERFVRDTFGGIFFVEEDLRFLDSVWANMREEPFGEPHKHSLVISALVRAAVKKQPRGVFTVGNSKAEGYGDGRRDLRLSIRDHFLESLELFEGVVFDDGRDHASFCSDIFEADFGGRDIDLVYLDPPYVPRSDDNDYIKRYHFLEGLSCYWRDLQGRPLEIMQESKVKKIKKRFTPFAYKRTAYEAFDKLFERFKDSTIVLSYSSNGYPDREELVEMMGRYKGRIRVEETDHRYHFGTHGEVSKERTSVREYVIVGE
jgi:DNA adenine methylase/adenine-specific DNA-methyltransferase